MVRLDGVDDDRVLLVLAGKLHAQLDVAALHLVVHGLAEVMEQSCALGKRDILAQLGGEQPRDVGHLDRVVQNVLPVRRAVLLTAQQLHELGVQVVDAGLERGAFALGLDGVLDLAARLFHHILDAGGVDAPVGDELFQRQTRDLAADGVKGRDPRGR